MKTIKVIPFITTLLIMIAIFGFSSQNSTESSDVSEGMTEKIINLLPAAKNLTAEEKLNVIKNIHGVMRKVAHFMIYASLGCSAAAMFAVIYPGKRSFYIWLTAVVFSALYASTDEIHQLFVDGRSGQVSDVLLDSSGAMLGGGVFLIAERIFKKVTGKRKSI